MYQSVNQPTNGLLHDSYMPYNQQRQSQFKTDRMSLNKSQSKNKKRKSQEKKMSNGNNNVNYEVKQIRQDLDVCPRHRLEMTNISVSEDLIEPLCPECIEEHVLLLQSMNITPAIKNISQVRKQCHLFLNTIKQQYSEQSQILNQFSQENLQNTINNQQGIIVQARNNAIAYIDQYFDNLQVSISQNIQKHAQKNPQEIQQLQSKLDKLLQQIDRKGQKLNGQFYMKTMLKMLQGDKENTYNMNCYNIQQELVKLEKGLKQIVIDNDENIFKNIIPNLEQYVKIDDATKFIKKDEFTFRILQNKSDMNNTNYNNGHNLNKNNLNFNYSNIMNKYAHNNNNPHRFQQIYPDYDYDNNQKKTFKHNLDHLQIQMDQPPIQDDEKYNSNVFDVTQSFINQLYRNKIK